MSDEKKWFTRRDFGRLCARASLGAAAYLSGCARIFQAGPREPEPVTCAEGEPAEEYEYIVVGSGAGGGPLAANLARKGHRVLLVEAGGDDENDHYRVPLFHPQASEDPDLRWDFFVRHYGNDDRSCSDPKFSHRHDGVFYPRSSTLGGCTAHNAMILVYPHNSDWDHIAKLTGDASWRSDAMWQYFERLENCQYEQPPETPADNPGRRGFHGWLPTSLPDTETILSAIRDRQMRKIMRKAVQKALGRHLGLLVNFLKMHDPNDWRRVKESAVGPCKTPLTTLNGRRVGSREYIREVERTCGGFLTVKLHTLVTRVLLDDNNTAVGIEYLEGKKLYRADRNPAVNSGAGQKGKINASREVILSGGAFNTPQLLMLSGIGPKDELDKHRIALRVELPGVGKNLQDRYEVTVVDEMKKTFSALKGLDLKSPRPGEEPSPYYRDWQEGKGILTTNGALLSFIRKSAPERPEPDLFIFGMPGYFAGYQTGYSERVARDQRHFTWAILKAHTHNQAGVVRLKSNDPRDTPDVNFHYFEEGSDASGEDLASVLEGVKFVRGITHSLRRHIKQEVLPGKAVQSDAQLKDFIKANAWGHHASCSCKMGPASDPMTVVDSKFRVHGAKNLRVVDASVFPRIPGFFIVSAVYMISEKASDVIHEDAVRADFSKRSAERA